MDRETVVTTAAQILPSDRVSFSYQNQTYTGYVAKKGKARAHVVTDTHQEFRVPYGRLVKLPNSAPYLVTTTAERRRTQFNVGDPVHFNLHGTEQPGVIVRLNPVRARVLCEDGKEYSVPYGLLRSPEGQPLSHEVGNQETRLETVVQRARVLLSQHGLDQWSFQFDQATKRAGCCRYDIQVISLSTEFAKRASDEEIADTLLHEIAHAVVGKAHHHDAVWQAKALEIGCSGRRCHEVQFSTPRYIIKCENGCWVTTKERRTRAAICSRCGGTVTYLTYTEERWHSVRASARNTTTDQ